MALLFDKGYDATTIEAVASHAGVAKKTVYRFAKNREELLGLRFETGRITTPHSCRAIRQIRMTFYRR